MRIMEKVPFEASDRSAGCGETFVEPSTVIAKSVPRECWENFSKASSPLTKSKGDESRS